MSHDANAAGLSRTGDVHAFRYGDTDVVLEFHPDGVRDVVSKPQFLKAGVWEATETAFFAGLLESATTVFDVGANLGWYTVLAGKRLAGRGTVVSFEPDPDTSSILERTIARNGLDNVTLRKVALGATPGRAHWAKAADNPGDNHLSTGATSAGQVDVSSVDTECARIGRPVDLIKIDVQGAEPLVFAGMQTALKQARKPVLISEFWPRGMQRGGQKAETYLNGLEAAGYEAFLIDPGACRALTFETLRHRVRTDLMSKHEKFLDLVLIPRGDPRRALIEPLLDPVSRSGRFWRDWANPSLVAGRRALRRQFKSE